MKTKNFRLKLRALATYLLLGIFVLTTLTAGATPATAQETIPRRAVITSLEGSVLVQAAGQPTALPARRNMEIKSGDRIITGRDGTAEIRYDDGSISRIGPGSRVDITNLSRQGTDGAETTVLSAQRGSIWNNAREVVQRNSRFEVNTPAAVAGVRGTNFLVRVQSAGETLVRVYQGLVGVNPAPPEAPEPIDEDILPPPLPPPGMPVNPFEQAAFIPAQPPPAAAEAIDYADIDDFEITSLAADNPEALSETVNRAAGKGITQFLQKVEDLIEKDENIKEQLGEFLTSIGQTITSATTQPFYDYYDYDEVLPSLTMDAINDIILPAGTETLIENIKEYFKITSNATSFRARSDNNSVISISNDQMIITGNPGVARLTITGTRSGYTSISRSLTVTVKPYLSIYDMFYEDQLVLLMMLHGGTFATQALVENNNNWVVNTGTTGLSLAQITRDDDELVVIEFMGTPAEGTISIQAKAAVLSGPVNSILLQVPVEAVVPAADKEALSQLVNDAITLKTATSVGSEPGKAPFEEHIAFQTAIFSAQEVLYDTDATQQEVYETVSALQTAINIFEAAIIPDPGTYQFAYGLGTEADPYEIWDLADLNGVRDHMDKHFVMKGDIDLEGSTFKPLGYGLLVDIIELTEETAWDGTKFTGTFDGNGFKIKNGLIDYPFEMDISVENLPFEGFYIGVFAWNEGTIENVGIENMDITGTFCVGSLAGINYGTITNCFSTGNVAGFLLIGGLVGSNGVDFPDLDDDQPTGEGTISNSYVTGNVHGIIGVGGLAGASVGDITCSFATGNVAGTEGIGGLVGANVGTITNSYATGDVVNASQTGTSTGGLVGRNYQGKLINTYSTGEVSGGNDIGGLVGSIYTSGDYEDTNNFWDTEASLQETSAMGQGKITAKMVQEQTFEQEWDFTNIWAIKEGESYPYLQWQGTDNIPYAALPDSGEFNSGSGTSNDPYVITTLEHLNNVRNHMDAQFIMAADINLEDANFEPLGHGAGHDYTEFTGVFDGDNHVIYNGTINYPSDNYIGLFAHTGSAAAIKNIGLENIEITGNNYAGGLAGMNKGTINNSYSTGAVTGLHWVGGLTGENHAGTIDNCYSSGTVTGEGNFVGGLVGSNCNNGTIQNSHSTGAVTGIDNVGGLIGFTQDTTITNSYSTGNVAGNRWVGGLIGQNSATVQNSYSTGAVTGNEWMGGLAGSNSSNGTIQNCYSTGDIDGHDRVGGLAGTNEGTITNSYSSGDADGNNFIGGLTGSNSGSGTIENSYSTGTVTGNLQIGGLIGRNDGIITNTYSIGYVTGNDCIGGLAGVNGLDGTITNSYWNTETSNQLHGIGVENEIISGVEGKSTAEMKEQGSFYGWDFPDTWRINPDVNDGYPSFAWQGGNHNPQTVHTVGEGPDAVTFNMRLAQAATFPTGTNDSGTTTVDNDFWIAETEVTYELWHKVYTWATHSERGEYIYHFQNPGTQGNNGGTGEPGARKLEPVTVINWRDTVVWLNALSEMKGLDPVYRTSGGTIIRDSRDNNATQVDAAEQTANDGFRLPTSMEWELAARWKGSDSSHGAIEHPAGSGKYWTPGNYASGATADYNDATATGAVAWYWDNSDTGSGRKAQPVGLKTANSLDLYDMSGNVWEWCFTLSGSARFTHGGCWAENANYLQVGYDVNWPSSSYVSSSLGFRPSRTP